MMQPVLDAVHAVLAALLLQACLCSVACVANHTEESSSVESAAAVAAAPSTSVTAAIDTALTHHATRTAAMTEGQWATAATMTTAPAMVATVAAVAAAIVAATTRAIAEETATPTENTETTAPNVVSTLDMRTLTQYAEPRIEFGQLLAPRQLHTQLEDKLEALSCDLPLLPSESRLWKGNETHELLLPVSTPDECPKVNPASVPVARTSTAVGKILAARCNLAVLNWEGIVQIQSGDVLLVRIDDTSLSKYGALANHTIIESPESVYHEPQPAVYQVTRTGYDHCDITEGILLDITPLKVDKRKVVTLYDKDLTEGINLLIVVSERWGTQCVRLKVTVKSDNCGENEDCSGKGVCYSNMSMEGYECQCCPGYIGPHCEEQDACYPSPCLNNGICVDISQGHEGSTFQCLCPYGYTGKTCQEETDPCTSMPCQNGATCVGNVTQFQCECPRGYSGPLCQHNLNECESSPCVHGICVDQEDGYRCFCRPGYGGSHCQYEYNECQSSPCINGGTCADQIGGYSCSCTRGYTGKRCHIKVDLCKPNPCPEHHYCTDHGNNYSCQCPKGYSGSDCLLPSRAACSTNPCLNGGTCWSSIDSFYCACRPGYTGKTCEASFGFMKALLDEAG